MQRDESPLWAWFDGRVMQFHEARVPIEDRGVQFAEAVYEVLAVLGGAPFRLDDHVARMREAAARLGIEAGVPPLDEWRHIIAQLHRREPHRTATLYAHVSGGSAPRRLVPTVAPHPLFFAYLRPQSFPGPAEAARGVAAITHPDARWRHVDLKTTGLLAAVLARRAAAARGADEALLIGQDGYVNEGAASSIFVVRGRTVASPPPSQRVLGGTSLGVVIEICRALGLAFEARPLTLSELQQAEEIFLASTSLLVMPVVRLDGRTVGSGTAGAVTLQISYHFQKEFWRLLEP
jgi:D-alanine transaminase